MDYSVKNGLVVDGEGTKIWYKNGQYHREDGPAIEYEDGDKDWYKDGKLHREDGPAVEMANGNKFWYKNGIRHREDGPAVEFANGPKEWYLEGRCLGRGKEGFWKLWELLNEGQKGNPNLLKWVP